MKGSEKVLAAIMAILVVLLVILSVKYINVSDSIGDKEKYLNDIHAQRINAYESQIKTLSKNITTLEQENEALTKQKNRVKIVTIREIDSITRLPFIGKADFFAREIARTDSSRIRYTRNCN